MERACPSGMLTLVTCLFNQRERCTRTIQGLSWKRRKRQMYLMSRHFSNRAVSQVIAALLLIAIAVAAAILLYVFSMGLLGNLGSGGGQQTRKQVIMEAYNFPVGGSLLVNLRNVGSASVDIGGADYFIDGVDAGAPTGSCAGATLAPS